MSHHDSEVTAYLTTLGFRPVGGTRGCRYSLGDVHALIWDSQDADIHTKPHRTRWVVYSTAMSVHDEVIGYVAVGVDGIRTALQRVEETREQREAAWTKYD